MGQLHSFMYNEDILDFGKVQMLSHMNVPPADLSTYGQRRGSRKSMVDKTVMYDLQQHRGSSELWKRDLARESLGAVY